MDVFIIIHMMVLLKCRSEKKNKGGSTDLKNWCTYISKCEYSYWNLACSTVATLILLFTPLENIRKMTNPTAYELDIDRLLSLASENQPRIFDSASWNMPKETNFSG